MKPIVKCVCLNIGNELSSLNGLKQRCFIIYIIVSLKYAIRKVHKQENLKSDGHLNS
jgi:hypothetical protein